MVRNNFEKVFISLKWFDHVKMNLSTVRNVLVYSVFEWFTVVYSVLQWFTGVYSGLQWFTVVYGGLEWFGVV